MDALYRSDNDPEDTDAWIESFDSVLRDEGLPRGALSAGAAHRARRRDAASPCRSRRTTPYINTIPAEEQPPYPGDRDIERRIRSLIRWNAMAMVVRANKLYPDVGGHISTFASCATLFEVGFNHFFRAHGEDHAGDLVYFQGHASPGVYARAFLEGRLRAAAAARLPPRDRAAAASRSYPHPWLMPDFWEFPTVSMGLSPISSIYQARFNRYLRDRGIRDTDSSARLGLPRRRRDRRARDRSAPSRWRRAKRLDNLIWVINCNLQRLDGPVRGNGKIIQELEALFRGAGWNVIKVIWGDDWDPLLARDTDGLLVPPHGRGRRRPVPEVRRLLRRLHPQALLRRLSRAARRWSSDLTDAKLRKLRRGGHDPEKVYAAYKAAVEHIRARRPSSSPRRSRATASARPARDATSPTSRRS